MRTINKYILAIIATIALVVGFTPTASAGGNPAPSPAPSIISSSAKSTSSMSTSAEAVNGVAVTSDTTVLTFVQPQGATKKQMKGKKLRLKKAGCYNTSWTPTSDKWHVKCYPKGKVFVKDRSGYWHDPECWNKVVGLPKGKNVTPGTQVTGKVIIVRTVEWSVTATATENGAAVATAAVACEANGSSASATSSSRSEYSAAASATASGSTREEATQNARNAAAAKALQMNLKSTVEGMAKVKAEGQAVAAAAAEAHCTGQPPASYVCPPGTTWNDDNGNGTVEPAECKHPGTIDMMEDVNDVVYGNSRTIRVTGTIPDGQAATLKSYAGIGTIAPSDQVKQVSGSFDILIRYTAPTEGTSDTVTVKLYSPQGVLWDQKSDSFGLGRPVTPQ